MSNQRVLLLKLRIKKNKKKIAELVEWNFGYCLNDKHFDCLVEIVHSDEVELSEMEGTR